MINICCQRTINKISLRDDSFAYFLKGRNSHFSIYTLTTRTKQWTGGSCFSQKAIAALRRMDMKAPRDCREPSLNTHIANLCFESTKTFSFPRPHSIRTVVCLSIIWDIWGVFGVCDSPRTDLISLWKRFRGNPYKQRYLDNQAQWWTNVYLRRKLLIYLFYCVHTVFYKLRCN